MNLLKNKWNKFHSCLKTWKPIHLCWFFRKMGWPIPQYFIGAEALKTDLWVVTFGKSSSSSSSSSSSFSSSSSSSSSSSTIPGLKTDLWSVTFGISSSSSSSSLSSSSSSSSSSNTSSESSLSSDISVAGTSSFLKKKRKKQSYTIPVEQIYKITGKVVLLHNIQYFVKSILAQNIHNLYNIIGIGKYLVNHFSNIVTKVKYLIAKIVDIYAIKKIFDIVENNISGIQQNYLHHFSIISGVSAFRNTETANLSGINKNTQTIDIAVFSKYKLFVGNEINILGTRNIINLLIALGLLDKKGKL